MGITAKWVEFTLTASAGPHTFQTNLGVQLKALVAIITPQTADGQQVGNCMCIGIATGTANRGCVGWRDEDGSASTTSEKDVRSDELICLRTHVGTLVAEGDVTSFASGANSDEFVITWATQPAAAYKMRCLCIGGDSITNAKVVKNQILLTDSGNTSWTGAGAQPDFCLNICGGSVDTIPITSDAGIGFGLGMCDGTNERLCYFGMRDNRSTTLNAARAQRSDVCVGSGNDPTYAGTPTPRGSFVSFDADGMTLNITNSVGEASDFLTLYLTGGDYAVGDFAQPTGGGTPQTQQVTSLSFEPSAVLFMGAQKQTNVSDDTDARMFIGGMDGDGNEAACWGGRPDHTAGNTVADNYTDSAKAIKFCDNTPAVVAQADQSQMLSNGFEVSWSTIDATARDVCFVAFGPATTIYRLGPTRP